MNIEDIKMDHFENFEELIKTCKMWIRDDDIDAYYRFFEFNCMKALLTTYEKGKEEHKKECHNCDEYTARLGELETENRMLKSELEKEKEIIKNAICFLKYYNKDFNEMSDDEIKQILYSFDKCADIKKEE